MYPVVCLISLHWAEALLSFDQNLGKPSNDNYSHVALNGHPESGT